MTSRRGLLKGLIGLPALALLGGREAGKSRGRFQPRDAYPVDLTATTYTAGNFNHVDWNIRILRGGLQA